MTKEAFVYYVTQLRITPASVRIFNLQNILKVTFFIDFTEQIVNNDNIYDLKNTYFILVINIGE